MVFSRRESAQVKQRIIGQRWGWPEVGESWLHFFTLQDLKALEFLRDVVPSLGSPI